MCYTGYFAVTLFFGGLLLQYTDSINKWHLPVLLLPAVFLAGGNYLSLLPCLILLVLATVWLFFRKSIKVRGFGIITLAMLAEFIVSAAAPGNQVRQHIFIKNLFMSVHPEYVHRWTTRRKILKYKLRKTERTK